MQQCRCAFDFISCWDCYLFRLQMHYASDELIFMLKVIFYWRPHKCNYTGYAIICSRAMDLFKRALHVFAFARVHSLSRAQTYLVVIEQNVELEICNVYLWWFHGIFCKTLFIKCIFMLYAVDCIHRNIRMNSHRSYSSYIFTAHRMKSHVSIWPICCRPYMHVTFYYYYLSV